MAIESKPAYEWAGLVGEVLVILLGAWMISWGWTDFGSTVVIVGLVGFVVSAVRLWRMVRGQAVG